VRRCYKIRAASNLADVMIPLSGAYIRCNACLVKQWLSPLFATLPVMDVCERLLQLLLDAAMHGTLPEQHWLASCKDNIPECMSCNPDYIRVLSIPAVSQHNPVRDNTTWFNSINDAVAESYANTVGKAIDPCCHDSQAFTLQSCPRGPSYRTCTR
jgi:hypothetical protein